MSIGTIISDRFACRRRTAANWESTNEVLLNSEIGVVTDSGNPRAYKIGDGTTAWNSLPVRSAQFSTAVGTNTLTATFIPKPVPFDGMVLELRAANANTGAVTFNPNSLGALAIKKNGGTALAAGDIAGTGHELLLRYVSGSPGHYELMNPATSAGGTVPTGTGFRHVTAGVEDATVTVDLDTDTTLTANSDLKIASQKAVKTYIDAAVAGLLDLKGGTACAANPNYPAASKGDAYYVTSAGKIGGASGKSVDIGDVFVASADNAGGTEASVGTSWFVLEHNLLGALIASNNLSDLTNVVTARSNLGLGAIALLASIATANMDDNAVTYAKMQDVSATSRILGRKTAGAGDPEECTLSEVLDFIGSAAQGDILYRGASSWARLAASAGRLLKSQGAGADPIWANIAGASGGGFDYVATGQNASAQTTLAVSGLDLATDQCYFILYRIDNATASSANISLYYNSDTTAANYQREGMTANSTTLSASRSNTGTIMTIDANETNTGLIFIYNDADGKPRAMVWGNRGAPAAIILQFFVEVWNSATNVTGVTLSSDIASSISATSSIKIFSLHA